ncbi:MAG TPA: ImmA/IrrE family metallo-endopeptidase [Anaerolineae bacterium]|nr:ImmA/IrrE family metallo-endopeptidase [Anaerolineae bacterium]HQI83360.1 ImmA/IrrE family metallo-endopeptidase [Anaerolineae bacterium]
MVSPNYAVERILDDLGIIQDDLKHLERLVWIRGAIIRYEPLHGAEARLTTLGKRAIITISTSVQNQRRQRFSIAHELGHLEMHCHTRNIFLCTSKDISESLMQSPDANQEQEANEFAATLLLPQRFFAPLCNKVDPSLDFIAELASEFEVSITATAIRYLKFCDEACAIVLTQNGQTRWFHASKAFKEIGLFIDVRCKVDPTTLAGALSTNTALQHIAPKRVKASAWFSSGQYRRDATILEQSWPMPSYDAVLTLLWVDDEINSEDHYYHRGVL